MMSCARVFTFVCILAHSLASLATAQTSTVRVATGVSRPVFAVAAPGDTDRLFIAEQHTGRIEIMDLNTGTILPTPFLDLSGLSTSNEQGLLGLAFDPDYANNGYVYVNVTTASDGGDTHIRRYQAQGDPLTSNVASLASQIEVLSFNQPQGNHNGGWIGFSPTDSYLYIATGDGGGDDDNDSGHTPGSGNSQDITDNLLGKILRIDVTSDDFPADIGRNYAVPDDNPFVGTASDDELWAYGLRNPFRSSFDRATGDLWIGDVGQDYREEIDLQRAGSGGGENYGWRLREGTIPTPTGGVGGAQPLDNVEPIYDYTHGDGEFQGDVVIGGYVYRGPVEHFQGHYFFADSQSHNIWKLDPDAIKPRDSVTRVNNDLLPDVSSIQFIGSFGEDAVGNLYIMEVFGGEIFRITTASQDIVWNGDDATMGAAGDGSTWGDANNWTRAGTPDQAFTAEDHVVFVGGSSQSSIELGTTRTVSAVTFKSNYALTNSTLRVLSGNISVGSGITAVLESSLQAESPHHSLRKLGMGKLLVEGTAGQTVVKEGTLGGEGTLDHLTVRDGGTVAPGSSIGALQVENSFTMEDGATLSIEIGGTGIGQFDQLLVDGVAQLDGTLEVNLVNSYVPQVGHSISFLAAQGGAGGTFDTFDLPDLGSNLEWQLNPGGVSVFLLVKSTLTGDFDTDGDADALDFLKWQRGESTNPSSASDLADWEANYGTLATPPAASAAVPEPANNLLMLAAIQILCLYFPRRIFRDHLAVAARD